MNLDLCMTVWLVAFGFAAGDAHSSNSQATCESLHTQGSAMMQVSRMTPVDNVDNAERAAEKLGSRTAGRSVTHLAGTEKTAPANVAWGLYYQADPNCGYSVDCLRNYTISDVTKSVEAAKAEAPANINALAQQRAAQEKACADSVGQDVTIMEHGGWCYNTAPFELVTTSQKHIDMDYKLPKHHVLADDVIVSTLAEQVLLKADRSCCHTLTDLGAGVGQYGHALRALLPGLEYYGYDGAGDVEPFTNNYVKYVDLTMPLSLKQTDWVMSVEVGEHIPHQYEKQVIANIHAHNCKGVILTWAVLDQAGHAHINNHSNDYLIKIFEELGYRLNEKLTAALRVPRPATQNNWYFCNSAMAFDRVTPPASCTK